MSPEHRATCTHPGSQIRPIGHTWLGLGHSQQLTKSCFCGSASLGQGGPKGLSHWRTTIRLVLTTLHVLRIFFLRGKTEERVKKRLNWVKRLAPRKLEPTGHSLYIVLPHVRGKKRTSLRRDHRTKYTLGTEG